MNRQGTKSAKGCEAGMMNVDWKKGRADSSAVGRLVPRGWEENGTADERESTQMDRFTFDEELFRRRIPSFTAEMLEQDLASLASRHLPPITSNE